MCMNFCKDLFIWKVEEFTVTGVGHVGVMEGSGRLTIGYTRLKRSGIREWRPCIKCPPICP